MGKDTYLTLQQACKGLYKEKGSKFIAHAYPVQNEEEVKTILEELSKEYYDARHVCYAYRIGPTGDTFRMNDDGEPSGTAGKPIYGQLLSHELTHVLIAVVRYFGGVKLGVGGLIQAYKAASKEAIAEGRVIEKVLETVVSIHFDYVTLNDVMRILKDTELEWSKQDFGIDCTLRVGIRPSLQRSLCDRLQLLKGVTVDSE